MTEEQRNRNRLRSKNWAIKNNLRVKENFAAWAKSNPERHAKNQSDWRASVSDRRCAQSAKRRAETVTATPAWANEFFIAEAYHLAKLRTKMLGFPWHVDHIVPLKSPLVCGLHVEHNLSVIPGIENLRKQNFYWPDMPS